MDQYVPDMNADLFRATLKTIENKTLASALHWLKNGGNDFPKPISIHLNLTLRCTARCVHCKQWTWPAHSEFTREQLLKLFRVFNDWGVKSLTFGGGNPLLFDEIEYALQTAKEHGFSVGIISEGISLSNSLADSIGAYSSWVRFSLDGPSPHIHDRIRNKAGLFDLVTNNIIKLRAMHSNLPIGINCVVQKSNYQHLSKMIDLGEKLGVTSVLFKLPHGNDPAGKYLLTDEAFEFLRFWVAEERANTHQVQTNLPQLHALLKMVLKKEDILAGRPVRSFYTDRNIHCSVPLFFVICDSEGNVFPCDYLQADTRLWDGEYAQSRKEFHVGNLLQEDSGTVLRKLHNLFLAKISDLPSSGYPECGCCTRFFQFNAAISSLVRGDTGPDSDVTLLSKPHADSTISIPFL